ncbi:MAG: chemotaxis protein CheX [Bdellovibrionaceae bacterium]|nr:chemotaxis protein CheX [Pseudobdellovibrionaceae bacterium]MBX3032562.1 chemotaxis protein CheX [Pseudobdellovibrionaceae bacterium]
MPKLKIEEKSSAVLLSLPLDLTDDLLAEFEAAHDDWLKKEPKLFLIDFHDVMTLPQKWVAPLVRFCREARTRKKTLHSLNINKALLKTLTSEGLELTLQPVGSLKEAYEKAGLTPPAAGAKPRLDTEFINPFIDAVINTFKVQLNLEIQPGKALLKKDVKPLPLEIAGVISLASTHFHGTISLGFPGQVFLKVYETWLGETHAAINQDIQDAAGELMNIVYGQAKAELNKKNYNIEKALPTVVTGEKLHLADTNKGTTLVIEFSSVHGPFIIEIAMD